MGVQCGGSSTYSHTAKGGCARYTFLYGFVRFLYVFLSYIFIGNFHLFGYFYGVAGRTLLSEYLVLCAGYFKST